MRIIIKCPERAILHEEAGYIYADYPFELLQTYCSSTADHTFTNWPARLPLRYPVQQFRTFNAKVTMCFSLV